MNEFAKPGLANDQFPPVSATDNGKVLTVADGKWAVGNASGGTTVVANPTLAGTEADLTGLQVGDTKYKVPEGGGALVVHVTATTVEESTIYTCDKTAGEMYEAMQTGVVVIAPYTEDSLIYGGVCVLAIDGNGFYAFAIAVANKTFTADSASGYPSYSKGGK